LIFLVTAIAAVVAMVGRDLNHVEVIKVTANAVKECFVPVLIVSMDVVKVAIITEVVEDTEMSLIDAVRCRLGMPAFFSLISFASPMVEVETCPYARIP
jgi:hypothetical protein